MPPKPLEVQEDTLRAIIRRWIAVGVNSPARAVRTPMKDKTDAADTSRARVAKVVEKATVKQ